MTAIKAITLSILVLGDLNFTGISFLEAFSRSGYDPGFPFSQTASFIQQADLAIANLEGPLTFADWSEESARKKWRFRQLPIFAQGIKNAGIDILLLGNNHIADAGEEGIEDTLRVLKENQIGWVPPPQEGPLVITLPDAEIEIWNADIFSPPGSHPWAVDGAKLVSLVERWYGVPKSPKVTMAIVHTHPRGPEFSLQKASIAGQLRSAGIQWVIFGGAHDSGPLRTDRHGGVHFGLGDFIFGCECSGAVEGHALELQVSTGTFLARDLPLSLGTAGNDFVTSFAKYPSLGN